jgi:hypothetical protein
LTDSTIGEPAIGDIDEIAQRRIAEPRIADRGQHQDRHVGDHKIVAVRRRRDHRLHPDGAAGAGARLHDEGLTEGIAQPIRHRAGEQIGGPAWRERVDDPHRPGRPILRCSAPRVQGGARERGEKERGAKALHGVPAISSRF